VGLSTFNWIPGDPNALPDFQIMASNPLGDGSAAVCDNQPPGFLGGVPAVDPPQFGGSTVVSAAINDLSCRFNPRGTQFDACTRNGQKDTAFASSESTVQFCSDPAVGAEIAFPIGDTRLTVRVRDTTGIPGEPASMILRVAPP